MRCTLNIYTVKAFVVTPPLKIMEFFCHFGGYDKGFYGNKIENIKRYTLYLKF